MSCFCLDLSIHSIHTHECSYFNYTTTAVPTNCHGLVIETFFLNSRWMVFMPDWTNFQALPFREFYFCCCFFICHNSRLNGFNFNNIVQWLEQFYSCMLSQVDYECKWAWKWPSFDTASSLLLHVNPFRWLTADTYNNIIYTGKALGSGSN